MCKKSFSIRNQKNKECRERIWFERWIQEGYAVRQLAAWSGHSPGKIRTIIRRSLNQEPPVKFTGASSNHVIFDGTFLHRPTGIVALMDANKHSIIHGAYGVHENSESQLTTFLNSLKQQGLSPISCTTDGNPHAIKVFRTLWPDIIMQRCLVHIQRQGLMWCRRQPKRADAKALRILFLNIMNIHTNMERGQFIDAVMGWESKYGKAIATTPEHGWVFSDLKRARSMLLKALPNMFYYLQDSRIPKTTNGLEGYFSRLKGYYPRHRGLAKTKRRNYFAWYFFLRSR